MPPSLEPLATLPDLTTPELRARWKRIFRTDPPPKLSRDLLIRALAYQLQEEAEGGLDTRTKRRLGSLARSHEAGGTPTLPSSLRPGTQLIREWRGRTHRVTVLAEGFDYAGRRYRSLSRIAREITGTRWSGPSFFGLKKTPGSRRKEALDA